MIDSEGRTTINMQEAKWQLKHTRSIGERNVSLDKKASEDYDALRADREAETERLRLAQELRNEEFLKKMNLNSARSHDKESKYKR